MTAVLGGPVLVVAENLGPAADMVVAELKQRRVPVVRFDAADFPQQLTLTAGPGTVSPGRDACCGGLVEPSGRPPAAPVRAQLYAENWIVSISDITGLAHSIHAHVRDGALEAAQRLLPAERPYPASDRLLAHLRD
jgi:hypothetical protein